ncbi:MAG: phosphomannomutase/phosphoglucomutase [Thalassospira sp.]|nr:phosphomannomutase/phosphoglucomutase [Thalassospira sp.]
MTTPHNFDPVILREYYIRGLVDVNLNEADAYAVGRSFAVVLQRSGGKSCALGYDGRLHAPRLARQVCKGLQDGGIDVVEVGMGPSPMLYFAVHHLGLPAGIQVTGSHNPSEYNGFKMMLGAKPFYGAAIKELADISARGAYTSGSGSHREQNVEAAYVTRLVTGLNLGSRTLKVAWDAGNGAAGNVLQQLVTKLPGQHILINEVVDGTFPAHHPDPTVAKNLQQLIEVVATKGCDLGIAFDGDGDRIGVVDSGGGILWGDQLLQLYAEPLLLKQPGATIIADVKASQALFDRIATLGGTPLMWKTGHSLIKAKMKETGSPLAGEMSGHIFFADRYYGFDDALYAAVRLLEILTNRPESLAELRMALPIAVNTPELRFPCSEARKFAVIEEIRPLLEKDKAVFSTVDGVRVNTTDGWWLLRASNTQDVLVARCESRDMAGLERVKGNLSNYLAKLGLDSSILNAA